MSAASQAIILDFLNLALLALALGIPMYAWVRAHAPAADWERSGNVWTGPFQALDLFVVLLLAIAIRSMAGEIAHKPAPTALTASQILSGSLIFILLAAGLLTMLRIRHANLTETFGLDRLSPRALLAWTLGGSLLTILATNGCAALWQTYILTPAWTETSIQPMVKLLRESPDLPLRLAIVLSACVLQPVTEEIVFRGYFYPAVKKHSDKLMGGLFSSMIFAALHFHVPTLGPLFFLGVLLVIAYETSGSLWVPIAIHAIFNTTTVVYQLAHG